VLFEHLFPVTAGSVLVVVCAVGPDFNKAGVQWGEAYDFAESNNITLVGGKGSLLLTS
jgi:hypothetical protein